MNLALLAILLMTQVPIPMDWRLFASSESSGRMEQIYVDRGLTASDRGAQLATESFCSRYNGLKFGRLVVASTAAVASRFAHGQGFPEDISSWVGSFAVDDLPHAAFFDVTVLKGGCSIRSRSRDGTHRIERRGSGNPFRRTVNDQVFNVVYIDLYGTASDRGQKARRPAIFVLSSKPPLLGVAEKLCAELAAELEVDEIEMEVRGDMYFRSNSFPGPALFVDSHDRFSESKYLSSWQVGCTLGSGKTDCSRLR
jgi:hypothetical protein